MARNHVKHKMKTRYDSELRAEVLQPETALEAVEELETFFAADIWFAKGAEWKTEEDMLKYLHEHFEICKNHIKQCQA